MSIFIGLILSRILLTCSNQIDGLIENFESNILLDFEKNVLFEYNKNSLNLLMDRKFINGIIRKYRPKKLLEVGVFHGGSSLVILNAIKDIENAFLYSVDIEKTIKSKNKTIGFAVDEYAPHLKNKWKLFTGDIVGKFIDLIGNDIDFVFLDSSHLMPGENMDFLMILPYLKKNAIIVVHDIMNQFAYKMLYRIAANNFLMSNLRGKKIIPYLKNKNNTYPLHLGAVILDDNQERYLFDYFFMLCSLWENIPTEDQIKTIRNIFRKHFEEKYLDIFNLCLEKNKRSYKFKTKNIFWKKLIENHNNYIKKLEKKRKNGLEKKKKELLKKKNEKLKKQKVFSDL